MLARDYKDPKCIQIGQIYPNSGNPQAGRIYDSRGISPSLDTCEGGNRQVKIAAMRGRNPENPSDRTLGVPTKQRLEINESGCSNTITTVQKDNLVVTEDGIRKLTPKEYWRLMGFNDEEFTKAEAVCSKTQLYKQAGNSIVVDVLVYLFEQIFKYVEVNDVKKVEETKTIKFETETMIDVAALKEKEPELFEELAADYPCENATYIFKVGA